MPIDYAKLARQHGGRPVASPSPAMDYAALAREFGGTLMQPTAPAVRHIPPGTGPRDLGLEFEQEEVDAADRKGLAGLAMMGGAAAAPAVGPAVAGAAGTALRVVANPYVAGGLAGTKSLVTTGDPLKAAEAAGSAFFTTKGLGIVAGGSKSLLARLAHKFIRAEKVNKAAVAAKEAVEPAYRGIPSTFKVVREEAAAGATSAARAAQSAREAASIAKPAAQTVTKTAPVVKSGAKPPPRATVRVEPLGADEVRISVGPKNDPVGTLAAKITREGAHVQQVTVVPGSRNQGYAKEMYRRLGVLMRERGASKFLRDEMVQPEAKAAVESLRRTALEMAQKPARGAVGAAKRTKAVQDAADPLESRLKASVMKPQELAAEVERKVLALKTGEGKGLSAAQVGAAIDELYGVGQTYGKQMAEMIFQTYGLR
jgi:hypothetical protein